MFIQEGICYKYTFIKLHPPVKKHKLKKFHVELVEFTILAITGPAEVRYLLDEPGCSFTFGLYLVFGLGSDISSKKSLCAGFL